MRVVRLDHRITIQEKTVVKVDGFDKEEWVDLKKVWSRKKDVNKAKIIYEASAAASVGDVIFIVRYSNIYKENMRIVDDLGAYNIKDVMDIEGSRKYLNILVEKMIVK